MKEIQLPTTWMNTTNNVEQNKQVAKERIEYDSIYISSKLNYILFRITYICSTTIKKNKRQRDDKYKIQDSVYILGRSKKWD